MANYTIEVENMSKQYMLGEVGTGTISHDLNRWWHKVRGKEDPYSTVGEVNDRSVASNEDYVWALKDIDFKVQQGEILGVIGKNGAGKSTLLKILSKVTGPTTGQIKMNGRVASLLEIGTGMHPELTGRENVMLNGAILGMTRHEIKSKFDDIIDFSGCAKYVDTPIKRYSSGMKVRLGFAVAAFLEPEILIVDEVLAVGDAEFQKRAIGKMQDVSKGGGRTVLFVSHNMTSIIQLCPKSILLDNGRMTMEGDSHDIVREYLNNDKKHISQIPSWFKASDDTKFSSECFELEGMYMSSEKDGQPLDTKKIYASDQPTYLHFIGTVHNPDKRLNIGFEMYNEGDQFVYFGFHSDNNDPNITTLEKGKVHFVAELPTNVLNEGDFKIFSFIGLLGDKMIYNRSKAPHAAISFSIIGVRGNSAFYGHKRKMQINPNIKWFKK